MRNNYKVSIFLRLTPAEKTDINNLGSCSTWFSYFCHHDAEYKLM